MSQKIKFEIDSGEVIEDPSQSEFATARLRLFSSGENRHGMYCEEDVLQSTAFTAYEKPVIFEIVGNDFGSHNEGKTVPAGFVVPNTAEFVREEDGRLALYVFAKIWKRYSGKFVDVFINRNKKKSKLSVEMMMDETEEREDGLIGMKNFFYTAATILGDFITEASPGANIEMLSFSKEYENAYRKEFGYDKYSELDFRIPSDVKENARMAIEKYEKLGRGGNSVSLSLAKLIIKEEFITPDKIRTMYKKLSSYSKRDLNTEEEKVRFELWGGTSGYKWSKELFDKIESIDNKRRAFFVYKNIEDANPAIRGIEPPVTVSQANEIARQADAIGSDEEKNGWAISISNFKKTHRVEDGKWVKKEGKEETPVKKKEFEEEPKNEEMAVDEPKVEEEPKSEEMAVEEEPKSEESPKDDEPKEEPKAEMSLDSYLDLAYTLSLMEEETESRKEFLKEEDEFALKCAVDEIKKEGEKDFAVVSKGMFAKIKEMSAKIAKMEAENKAYMSEFESLKSFKKSADEARFSYEVESTLKEVEAVMPSEEIEKARTESVNFSVDNIDAWKNAVKAKAFVFAKPSDKKNTKPELVNRWAFGVDSKVDSGNNIWVKTK